MNFIQVVLILDAAALITCVWCFDAMACGRKTLTGEYRPEPAPSELYVARSDWRRGGVDEGVRLLQVSTWTTGSTPFYLKIVVSKSEICSIIISVDREDHEKMNIKSQLLLFLELHYNDAVHSAKLMYRQAGVKYQPTSEVVNAKKILDDVASGDWAQSRPALKVIMDDIERGSVGCGSDESDARLAAYRQFLGI